MNCLLRSSWQDEFLLRVVSKLFELLDNENHFQWIKHFCLWCLKESLDLKVAFNQNLQNINMIYSNLIWCNLLWSLKAFLDLKVFSQRLQGMTIPSIWLASMWSFMALLLPSFPHTLQRSAIRLTFGFAYLFSLFSIIDFTISSSWSKSADW